MIQDYLKQIGVQVTLKMLDFSTTMDEVVGNHQFDAYLMGNTLNADPNPKPYWHSTAASDEPGNYAWNISGFRNPEADTLMHQALTKSFTMLKTGSSINNILYKTPLIYDKGHLYKENIC